MAESAFPILFLAPRGMTDAILASGLLKRLSDEVDNAAFTVVAGDDGEGRIVDLIGQAFQQPRSQDRVSHSPGREEQYGKGAFCHRGPYAAEEGLLASRHRGRLRCGP